MHNIRNFVGIMTAVTLMCGAVSVGAVQSPNPRGTSNGSNVRTTPTTDSETVQRSGGRMLASRSTSNPSRVATRGVIVSSALRGGSTVARSANSATSSRSAVVRSAKTPSTTARSATSSAGSRTSMARATAVFSDVSKIGGGYANCRDAYATCMDQFCATANDIYRRCFCSSRFSDFSETEAALDQAKTLLMKFEDNNLNAVDKTAAEVNAMYSATVGEAAIKNDTSGAADILNQIGDLLSGKTKVSKASKAVSSYSLGTLNLDSLNTSGDLDDIWSGGGSSSFGGSIFSSNRSSVNLAELEGESLYNESNKQCIAMVSDTCSSDAVLQMARSSYNIMITQDCNAYEKSIDSKKEAVKQTVRTAEKYLREARLEEYRAHNSADINECIGKVKTALLADTACGANYKRCLDYSGAYINQTTGDAIYTPRLFQLNDLITLDGTTADVLKQNKQFNDFLDSKRAFAANALDSCRDIADTVWTEFKRTALIEIAQAQDEKIEEIKMSCVSTMAQCYDRQTSSLIDFDTTTAQTAGVASVVAARAMCQDKVIACASLYGDTTGCVFDGNGKLTNPNNATNRCGLQALLSFVDTVDTTRITEACDTIIDNYIKDLCTPSGDGKYGYPYKCRTLSVGSSVDLNDDKSTSLYGMLGRHVKANCSDPTTSDGVLSVDITTKVVNAIRNISDEMDTVMSDICEATYSGIWVAANRNNPLEDKFYITVFGSAYDNLQENGGDWGYCLRNTIKTSCEEQDANTGGKGYAKYDAKSDKCIFTDDWYKVKCESINGYWDNGNCFVAED